MDQEGTITLTLITEAWPVQHYQSNSNRQANSRLSYIKSAKANSDILWRDLRGRDDSKVLKRHRTTNRMEVDVTRTFLQTTVALSATSRTSIPFRAISTTCAVTPKTWKVINARSEQYLWDNRGGLLSKITSLKAKLIYGLPSNCTK